jgi:hypothetical protein
VTRSVTIGRAVDLVRHKGVAVPNLSYDAIFNPTHTVMRRRPPPIPVVHLPPSNKLLQHHPHEATHSVNRNHLAHQSYFPAYLTVLARIMSHTYTPGRVSLAECPWQSVPGRVSLAECPWQSVPGRVSLASTSQDYPRRAGQSCVQLLATNPATTIRSL